MRRDATTPTDEQALTDGAVDLARRLLADSLADATRSERRRLARLGRLLEDPAGRELLFALTDEVVRITDPARAGRRFAAVVDAHPTRAISLLDRILMLAGARVAPLVPRVVMPLVTWRIKHETRGMVLPAEEAPFARHLRARAHDGVRLNVNALGEAILSDDEADARMQLIGRNIDRSDVDYISVKVSAIVANLDAAAFDDSLDRVCATLRTLYRRAEAATPRVFVNLDMEEYRDLELTLAAFMRVLDEHEFDGIDAGIVLQAYLPDSHDALGRLGDWAARRHDRTGATIKVRLVKGANLAAESVEAELHNWEPAPYRTKADTDASYKAMLDSALRPEWAGAVRVGLASHNLFDIAWALTLGRATGTLDRIEFEMLEGMAPAQARQVQREAGNLLMYAPVVTSDDFTASIAYLTRRLDENTQPDNFLRSLFTLRPDSPSFRSEEARLRESVAGRHTIATSRLRGPLPLPEDGFGNAPDGDMTDPMLRAAIASALATPPDPDVLTVDDESEVNAIVARARSAFDLDVHTVTDRRGWLLAAADLMERERARSIALMAHEVGKVVREADPEVSEAIDFCRYYATEGRALLDDASAAGFEVGGRGVVAIASPWNFPYAIPTGGVAAALAAGNSVILKPAPEAVRVGAWIVDQLWRAGVPRDVLQLVVCPDGPVGSRLVGHPDVDTVVLTGSYDTASMFLADTPGMRLLAETSGKNALVVTPSADLDLAIADLVRSAFGHAGQKCSAASLGILVGELYDDPSFRRRLSAAVRSLRIGPATNPASMIGPLVQSPRGALGRALTALEPGQSWLVEPQRLDASDDRWWSPGVLLGVEPGSWFHQTECFGPVLGLMHADTLDQAIELQNGTAYGLTGGLHSLDPHEIEQWLGRVAIGNAYVNRHITGAVVRRQPFGGWKRSNVGGGSKAGGPAYVAQFARVDDRSPGPEPDPSAFATAWRELTSDRDDSGLAAESNVLRHRPLVRVAARHDGSADRALAILRLAATITGVGLIESDTTAESDQEFAHRCADASVDRVRLLTTLDAEALAVLHRADVAVDRTPPITFAPIELRRWAHEQAISRTLHRHGRLVPPPS